MEKAGVGTRIEVVSVRPSYATSQSRQSEQACASPHGHVCTKGILAEHVSLTPFATHLTSLGIRSVDSLVATLLTKTPARHKHTTMATFPNAMLLAGKVCAITGGVSGIGRAIAIEYLRQGGAVAVNHLGDDKSTELFKSLKADVPKDAKLIGIGGDIGKPQTGTDFVKATVSEFGSLDVFVANAGVSVFHDFLT